MNVKIESFMTMQRVSLFMCKESRDGWMTMCMATLSNTYECQFLRYPYIVGSVFEPIRFLLPVCRLC
jgi:hypothetical protein